MQVPLVTCDPLTKNRSTIDRDLQATSILNFFLPLLHNLLAGGILSGGSGLACIVSMRFPHVGGGEGIILKSISDFDFDGSTSLTCGTTGSAGGWGSETELVEAVVPATVPPPVAAAAGREVAATTPE